MREKPSKVITDKCIEFQMKTTISEITPQKSILYALGITYSQDGLNKNDLQYTYELHPDFQVFPTIGTCVHNTDPFEALNECPGIPDFDPMKLLHGEQRLEIHQPLKPEMKLKNTGKIMDVVDKGKGALVTFEINSMDAESGQKVFTNYISLFIRGIGGFGYKGNPKNSIPQVPKRAPDYVVSNDTNPNQAIIYRLSGDMNPLHIDSDMAAIGGFEKPILHGLCFYGISAKVICSTICNNDSSKIRAIQSRFVSSVYPGETLIYKLWKEGNKVFFNGSTKERQNEVIVGIVELIFEAKI